MQKHKACFCILCLQDAASSAARERDRVLHWKKKKDSLSPGILFHAIFAGGLGPVTIQCFSWKESQYLCPSTGNNNLREGKFIPQVLWFWGFFFFSGYICSLVYKNNSKDNGGDDIITLPRNCTLFWAGQWFLRSFVVSLCFSWKL